LNNLLVLSREDAGAEAILAFDNDLRRMAEFIQRNERIAVLGTLRILGAIAKNSYNRVKFKIRYFVKRDFFYQCLFF